MNHKLYTLENDEFHLRITDHGEIQKLVKDWEEIKSAVQDYIMASGAGLALKRLQAEKEK